MRPLVPMALLLVLAFAVAPATRAAGEDGGPVYFASSSSRLTAEGYLQLRALADSLKAQPAMKLELAGHADASGSKVQNRDLARERAEVVREYLASMGVDSRRLVVRGYGDTQPVNDNSTLELRAFNRRVHFKRTE